MIRKLALVLTMIVLGMMVFVVPSEAQRGGSLTGRGGAMGARGHAPSRGAPHGGYLTGPRRYHRSRGGYGSAGYPYIYPYYYPDYYSGNYSEQAPAEAPPTHVTVVQNSQPHPEAPPPPPPQSLVLELQGNHWVRITSSGQTQTAVQSRKQGSAQASNLRTITPQQSTALEASQELPPAILVFRDGHKEKITRYTIVGETIYTNNEYLNNGSWTRKVPIAELNIPATLELNRERGTKFSLPSSPGEIVVRP